MSLRVTREDTKIMCFSLHLKKKLKITQRKGTYKGGDREGAK
jgi:hypothetical protein